VNKQLYSRNYLILFSNEAIIDRCNRILFVTTTCTRGGFTVRFARNVGCYLRCTTVRKSKSAICFQWVR